MKLQLEQAADLLIYFRKKGDWKTSRTQDKDTLYNSWFNDPSVEVAISDGRRVCLAPMDGRRPYQIARSGQVRRVRVLYE